MARLSGGLVWAVVLWFVMLGVGVSPGNGDPLETPGYLPRMRIICKENDRVSVAVRNNNTVVFVRTNVWDQSQLWVRDYHSVGKLAADDGCRMPFVLVNVGTGLAMIPAENKWDPMRLAQYNPDECVPLSMLWTVGEPVRDDFYMIKLFRDESKAFNGLGGNVREGTILGWGGTGPTVRDNILFKIVGLNSMQD